MSRPSSGWVEFAAHDLAGVAAAVRAGARISLAAFVALQGAVARGAAVALIMDRRGGVATVYGPTAWLPPADARALRAAGWRAGREPHVGGVYDLEFEVAARRANPDYGALALPRVRALCATHAVVMVGGIPDRRREADLARVVGCPVEWVEAYHDRFARLAGVVKRVAAGRVGLVLLNQGLVGHKHSLPLTRAARAAGAVLVYTDKGGTGSVHAGLEQAERELAGAARRNPAAAYPQTAKALATLAEGGIRVGLPLVLRLQQIEEDGGGVRVRRRVEPGVPHVSVTEVEYVVLILPRPRSLRGAEGDRVADELIRLGFQVSWNGDSREFFVIGLPPGSAALR